MALTPTMQRFIEHFGDMSNHWGINRSVGQIYALLLITKTPLCAEEICNTLGFARSNVSTGLKELAHWQLLHSQRYRKDRKDYFSVPKDPWETMRILVEARRKRELEPTLSMLDELLTQTDEDKTTDQYALDQMQAMHAAMDGLTKWYNEIKTIETEGLLQLMKLGSTIHKLHRFKEKIKQSKHTPLEHIEEHV